MSGAYVFNAYGPTEATVFVTVGLIREGQAVDLGKPLRNVRILIMDEHMRELNVGEKVRYACKVIRLGGDTTIMMKHPGEALSSFAESACIKRETTDGSPPFQAS